MTVPRRRRRWVVLAVVVVMALVALRLLYQPMALESYRILDPQTLVVSGFGGQSARPNLSEVTETGSTVTIRVDAFTLSLGPGTAAAHLHPVVVPLTEPLGTRTVIDGSTGQPIPAAPPP